MILSEEIISQIIRSHSATQFVVHAPAAPESVLKMQNLRPNPSPTQ